MQKILAFSALVSLGACVDTFRAPSTPTPPAPLAPTEQATPPKSVTEESCAAQPALRFASYNVENLHDTAHDPDKNDWEFLPKDYPGRAEFCAKETNPTYRKQCEEADWTEDKLALKNEQIKRVVGEFGDELPHFLALVEVENEASVVPLAKVLGYAGMAVTESPDERGMDVGLLWNEKDGVKFLAKQEHVVNDSANATRNILQVDFEIACGRRVSVFVNHWPSQGNPSDSRIIAAQTLRRAVDAVLTKNPAAYIVSLGDYNVVSKDRPDAFYEVLQSAQWSSALTDLDPVARAEIQKKDYPRFQKMAFGTYFFGQNMEWNLLDHAFLSRNLTSGGGLEVDLLSYRIVNPAYATRAWTYNDKSPAPGSVINNIPLRYDFLSTDAAKAGFSDHFPIYFELKEKAER